MLMKRMMSFKLPKGSERNKSKNLLKAHYFWSNMRLRYSQLLGKTWREAMT